ncbi:uncharacterized protein LOC136084731 [Hydra vulgaris]|uniref:Uncharacterized protein LOC136084731 n=1 Tax=Hydra vulgaris TaxID=6087 RepID=A0ABM4CIB6_HYDVU
MSSGISNSNSNISDTDSNVSAAGSGILSRAIALNRIIESYVDSMFDKKKFSNFLANGFKDAYLCNKEIFIEKSKTYQDHIKAELLQDITNYLKKASIIKKLNQLDEYELNLENEPLMKYGSSLNLCLLSAKEQYLIEHENSVEAEYSALKNKLIEKLKNLEDIKTELKERCCNSEKDLNVVRLELEKLRKIL